MTFRLRLGASVGALVLCTSAACGPIDQSSADGSIPIQSRWLFIQAADALTLVEFDHPRRAPHLDTREPVSGWFWWSRDAERVLVLGETAETTLLAEAPSWQPFSLPMPEVFERAYFLGSDHFLAGRDAGSGEEWVLRTVDGSALQRWGNGDTMLTLSPSGAFAALHGEELTLVRRDLTSIVLTGPNLSYLSVQVRFDEAGEHALIATRPQDALDFGALPDFVAHVEMEESPSCAADWDCRAGIEMPTALADSGLLAARASWTTSDGYTGRVLAVPLGEKTVLLPPDATDPHILTYFNEIGADVWVDQPTGRVRLLQEDVASETWTVNERDALNPGSDWTRIAEGLGSHVSHYHVDFDLIWLRRSSDGFYYALDLASGRPPRAVDSNSPRSLTWQRRALFLGRGWSTPCELDCPYVAYADPSDPSAPVLSGTLDALHLLDHMPDADFQWAPDQSGLLLRSGGWLFYHAFAKPSVRFRLAPITDDAFFRVPPVW